MAKKFNIKNFLNKLFAIDVVVLDLYHKPAVMKNIVTNEIHSESLERFLNILQNSEKIDNEKNNIIEANLSNMIKTESYKYKGETASFILNNLVGLFKKKFKTAYIIATVPKISEYYEDQKQLIDKLIGFSIKLTNIYDRNIYVDMLINMICINIYIYNIPFTT